MILFIFYFYQNQNQTLNAFFSKPCFQNACQKYPENGWTDSLEIWRT